MEKKEEMQTPDIFWSREPIYGPRGTKENPAIIPSYNESRVVGLETEVVRAPPRAPPPHSPDRRAAKSEAQAESTRPPARLEQAHLAAGWLRPPLHTPARIAVLPGWQLTAPVRKDCSSADPGCIHRPRRASSGSS